MRRRRKKNASAPAAATRTKPPSTPPAMAPALECLDDVDRSSEATGVEVATGCVTGVNLGRSRRLISECFDVASGNDCLLKALEQHNVSAVRITRWYHDSDIVLDIRGEIGLGCQYLETGGVREWEGVSGKRLDCAVAGVDTRPELVIEIDSGIHNTVPSGEEVSCDGCT